MEHSRVWFLSPFKHVISDLSSFCAQPRDYRFLAGFNLWKLSLCLAFLTVSMSFYVCQLCCVQKVSLPLDLKIFLSSLSHRFMNLKEKRLIKIPHPFCSWVFQSPSLFVQCSLVGLYVNCHLLQDVSLMRIGWNTNLWLWQYVIRSHLIAMWL